MSDQPNSTNPKDAFGRQKPGISNIPPSALIHEAMAMKNGADKYGPFNWRKTTVSARVYVDAMFRHLMRYWDGEEVDPETGVHHLGHLRASAGILIDAREQKTLIDDRPAPGRASDILERLTRKTGMPVITQGQLASIRAKPEESEESLRNRGFGPTTTEAHGVQNASAIRRKRCYLAGPMRGLPKYNFPAFDAARDLARDIGWDPISPADLDRENGIHEDTQPVTDTLESKAALCREFVTRDTAALISLRAEKGDAIAVLPGWEKSTGALAEFFVARWLQLVVLDATTMMPFTRRDVQDMDGFAIQKAASMAMERRS